MEIKLGQKVRVRENLEEILKGSMRIDAVIKEMSKSAGKERVVKDVFINYLDEPVIDLVDDEGVSNGFAYYISFLEEI